MASETSIEANSARLSPGEKVKLKRQALPARGGGKKKTIVLEGQGTAVRKRKQDLGLPSGEC